MLDDNSKISKFEFFMEYIFPIIFVLLFVILGIYIFHYFYTANYVDYGYTITDYDNNIYFKDNIIRYRYSDRVWVNEELSVIPKKIEKTHKRICNIKTCSDWEEIKK